MLTKDLGQDNAELNPNEIIKSPEYVLGRIVGSLVRYENETLSFTHVTYK